jgi:hypothetical protein
MAALEGDAERAVRRCKSNLTYCELCAVLKQNYGNEEHQERYQQELHCRKQKPGETLQELANDILDLSALAYPDTAPEEREKLFELSTFVNAISDPELRKLIRTQEHKSLRAALNGAIKLEVHLKNEVEKEAVRPKHVRGVQQEPDSCDVEQRNRAQTGGKRPNYPSGRDFRNAQQNNPENGSHVATDVSPELKEYREESKRNAERCKLLEQQLAMQQQQVAWLTQ